MFKNNTAETQHLNLFDQSDPDSGGVFTGGGQRVINYDLSTYSFHAGTLLVNMNFNSTEVPIDSSSYQPFGISSIQDLVDLLNTLGLGTFVLDGTTNIHSDPNYALASDNGGLEGAVLLLADCGNATVNISGNANMPIPNPFIHAISSLTSDWNWDQGISPGFSTSLNLICQNDIPNTQSFSITGTATDYWGITIKINGVIVQQYDSGVAGTVNWESNQMSVEIGDSVDITVYLVNA